MGATSKLFLETKQKQEIMESRIVKVSLDDKPEEKELEGDRKNRLFPEEEVIYSVKWHQMPGGKTSRDSATGMFSVDNIGGGYRDYRIKRKNYNEFSDWVWNNSGKIVSSYVPKPKPKPEHKKDEKIGIRYTLKD